MNPSWIQAGTWDRSTQTQLERTLNACAKVANARELSDEISKLLVQAQGLPATLRCSSGYSSQRFETGRYFRHMLNTLHQSFVQQEADVQNRVEKGTPMQASIQNLLVDFCPTSDRPMPMIAIPASM